MSAGAASAMNSNTLWLDGIGWWSPGVPGWAQAQAALRGETVEPTPVAAAARPSPTLLAANERRRAPDAVLLALEVAAQAAAASGHDSATLATVFASTHGDLAITDAMCRTLAADPTLLSPTRFHHSVHNAGSGYWAIGSGSSAASTALAAFDATFATGLMEAASQCQADGQPVMLVVCDTEAAGPLRSVNRSRGLLALALVLSPRPGPQSVASLQWDLKPGAVPPPQPQSALAQGLASNASAAALPLAEALAQVLHLGGSREQAWPLSAGLGLHVRMQALHPGQHPTERPPELRAA
jgi:Beta-ketoacyl synthase, N-terminal domain